ncbi:MAG: Eco57I restriction-modification methylase domain-containing protein [Candidatus Pacebacteria bacterium]|nr:Eco57I restriction-modification methylase domain-containing protein [Candidatus Paceibacterota bacterium]
MAFIQLTKEESKEQLRILVKNFQDNIDQYKRASYIEAHVRKEFIDKFFKILGWDVDNEQGYAEQYKEVINEDSLKISGKTKAPDYGFRIGGQRKFFVEAKKPFVNIKDEGAPAYQIRRYSWNAKLPISILTDFEEFAVYDCTNKPNENDKASVSRITYFTYDKYEEKFDEIYDIFSKQAVLKGSFDRFIVASKGKKGTSQVDDEFLKEIEEWRDLLAKNIALKNKDLSIDELNFSVQITIDRILFLRFCEDKSMEKYGKLQQLTTKTNIYKELLSYFKHADDKYNSGIFNFNEDEITPYIVLDDKILKNIIDGLYYPISPYEFSIIGVEILGNIYEQFLGKIIRLTPSHKAKVEEKPEVKKAGGIYYTPQYIVDYIVKNTIGKQIKGKTPKQIEKIRILDPACGSGSFLLGAYSYLLDYHLNYYIKNNPKKFKKDVFQVKENQWLLTSERRKSILLNNIYGIDIDSQAVEVSKLSLLLKVLEHETKESINQQLKLTQERALPNLGENIKCGNSLIGTEFYKEIQMTLTNTQKLGRINIFDWEKEYVKVADEGGFDIIIGNPPYIQIQKLKEFYPEEIDFYQKTYETAKENNIDIYICFIEKSMLLLKKKGVLGFICPNRFFNSNYGANLRYFLKNYNIYHLVNFRHYFVFNKSDIYTCLLFVQNKRQQTNIIYKEIRELYKNKDEKINYLLNNASVPETNFEIDNIKPQLLKKDKLYFMTENENIIFEKITRHQKFIEFYKEFFVGVQTSRDKVYILKYLGESNKEYYLYSIQNEEKLSLEKGIVKPIIDNNNIESYNIIPAEKCVIFPYKIENGKATLYSQKELENKYPNTWTYLLENKKILENREKGRMKGKNWYAYIYPKNLTKQNSKKILIPHVVKNTIAAIDEKGEYCLDNVGANGIIIKDEVKEHNYYFLAILNSPISSFFISKTSIYLSGGFYATNKQFAGEIPIKTIDFSNTKEKNTHDKIVRFVADLIELNKKLHSSKLRRNQETISRQIDAIQTQINNNIYELYDVSAKEREIIKNCIFQ